MNNRSKLLSLIDQIQHSLTFMKIYGFDVLYCSKKSLNLIEGWQCKKKMNEIKHNTLSDISTSIANCKKCDLFKDRTNIVFGEGNGNAKLVFLGEGPGSEEDKTGRPFIGRAGQLLTRIIEAMNLTREEVYICNVVKCRPPGNRNPNHEEIRECMPFLLRQIRIIRPEVICVLGAVAAKSLLNTNQPISKIRGTFVSLPGIKNIKVMPTYHPAYLLRNPNKKREVWEDIKQIINVLK